MKIWNGIESYPTSATAVVGTIGNYDGVHLGHQAILRSVVDTARRAEVHGRVRQAVVARRHRLLQSNGRLVHRAS